MLVAVNKMSISIRYVQVTLNDFSIQERFLTYVHVRELDAQSLTTTITNTLQKHGLELENLVSRGYDGASVMSGHLSGVQERIRRIAPQATYIHCHAHNYTKLGISGFSESSTTCM